jgi:nucleotide-binding universal stress UspA family protein
VDLSWTTDAWRDLLLDELHQQSPDPDWLLLAEAVRPYQALYPRVPVKLVLHRAPVVPGLLRALRGAELLVVGTAGHGRLGSATGSVSRAMSGRAGCPVVVVPAGTAGDPAGLPDRRLAGRAG